MSIVNEVRLIGNLGGNPELFTTDKGKNVLRVSVATSSTYKNDKGEKVESTDWHNVVMFGTRAIATSKYCKKGSKVAINGRLSTRTYDDKQGVTKYITEIITDDILFLTPSK